MKSETAIELDFNKVFDIIVSSKTATEVVGKQISARMLLSMTKHMRYDDQMENSIDGDLTM